MSDLQLLCLRFVFSTLLGSFAILLVFRLAKLMADFSEEG